MWRVLLFFFAVTLGYLLAGATDARADGSPFSKPKTHCIVGASGSCITSKFGTPTEAVQYLIASEQPTVHWSGISNTSICAPALDPDYPGAGGHVHYDSGNDADYCAQEFQEGSCPAYSTQNPDGTCSCSGGSSPVSDGTATTCSPTCPLSPGHHSLFFSAPFKTGTGCSFDGCSYSAGGGGCALDIAVTGPGGSGYSCDVVVGGTCNPGASGTGTELPPASTGGQTTDTCGAGTSGGYVNGVWTCVPSVGGTSSSSSSSSSSSGATSTTTTDCSGNGSTVTCNNTTSTTSGGSTTTSTTTTTQSQADYCAQNPGSKPCGGGAGGPGDSFGGTCSTGFTCDGDALQCATALAVWKTECGLIENGSPQKQLFDDVIAGNDPVVSPSAQSQRDTHTFSSLDMSSFYGSAGLSDQVITLWDSRTLTLPWSSLNPWLSAFGSLLVGVCLIVAARIVAEGL